MLPVPSDLGAQMAIVGRESSAFFQSRGREKEEEEEEKTTTTAVTAGRWYGSSSLSP